MRRDNTLNDAQKADAVRELLVHNRGSMIPRAVVWLEEFAELLDERPVVVGDKPVAWRYRSSTEPSGWTVILSKARAEYLRSEGYIVEPLFTLESMVRGKS